MVNKSCRLMSCAVLAAAASMLPPTAQAQDFFSAFFGGLGGGRPFAPAAPLPFASERGYLPQQARPRRAESAQAGGQAFCVRTCDGRYFPISASDNQSRAASCNNFCPASDTKVVYGGSIDSAVTESGKAYSDLPNAYRYRNEVVAWAFNREDGGRSFGFTGGHTHTNWANDDFRRLVVNAILWTAKVEVPKDGAKCELAPGAIERNLDDKRKKK